MLPISFLLFNFAIIIVVALNLFAYFFVYILSIALVYVASFLHCSLYSFQYSNNCDSNSCRSFLILRAIGVKKKKILSPIRARKNHNLRKILLLHQNYCIFSAPLFFSLTIQSISSLRYYSSQNLNKGRVGVVKVSGNFFFIKGCVSLRIAWSELSDEVPIF